MSNVVFLYTNSDELWAVIQCQSASALQSVLTFLITPWLFPKPVSLQEAVWPLQQHFRCMTTIIVFMNVTKILFDICLTEITVLHVIRDAHLLSFTDNWFWTGQCGGVQHCWLIAGRSSVGEFASSSHAHVGSLWVLLLPPTVQSKWGYLVIGVNVCVNGCLSLYVSPVMNWHLVHGTLQLTPWQLGLAPAPRNLTKDKRLPVTIEYEHRKILLSQKYFYIRLWYKGM